MGTAGHCKMTSFVQGSSQSTQTNYSSWKKACLHQLNFPAKKMGTVRPAKVPQLNLDALQTPTESMSSPRRWRDMCEDEHDAQTTWRPSPRSGHMSPRWVRAREEADEDTMLWVHQERAMIRDERIKCQGQELEERDRLRAERQ